MCYTLRGGLVILSPPAHTGGCRRPCVARGLRVQKIGGQNVNERFALSFSPFFRLPPFLLPPKLPKIFDKFLCYKLCILVQNTDFRFVVENHVVGDFLEKSRRQLRVALFHCVENVYILKNKRKFFLVQFGKV